MKKIEDAKKKVTIMLRPSVKKVAQKKAVKMKVSFSQLIEMMIYDYNVE
jgi:hypothetical protein